MRAGHSRRPGRGFRIGAGVMSAVFAASAAVQWNDPDPFAWIALYGLAAMLAAAAAAGRLPLLPNAAAFGLFLVLTALWLPSLGTARAEAFSSIRMQATRDEEPRETVGLALCAVWSLVQTQVGWRHRR